MAYKNDKGVYLDAHNDKRKTSHIDVYSSDPSRNHSSIHINIKPDGTGSVVEKDESGNKETTYLDFND